jgi:carboxymethylenebutenolidase
MCELDDMDEFARRAGDVTRRQFGAMALGAGLIAALPRLADAAETKATDLDITTPDGTCDAFLVHPVKGKHPGVLIWPDIFGLRPAFREMATRLAESGYSVLVINPFYRTKKAPTAPEHPDFNSSRSWTVSLASIPRRKSAPPATAWVARSCSARLRCSPPVSALPPLSTAAAW